MTTKRVHSNAYKAYSSIIYCNDMHIISKHSVMCLSYLNESYIAVRSCSKASRKSAIRLIQAAFNVGVTLSALLVVKECAPTLVSIHI